MPELAFHPTQPGYLIWSDYVGCSYESRENCHVESYLSLDDGGNWKLIETYVERCDFAEPLGSSFFKNGIICASHRDKTGPQRGSEEWNPLEVTISYDWYETKGKLFDHIIGFENSGNLTFVASILLDTFSLDPYVSVDGRGFVKASFPPKCRTPRRSLQRWSNNRSIHSELDIPTNHRFRLLESSMGYFTKIEYRWNILRILPGLRRP